MTSPMTPRLLMIAVATLLGAACGPMEPAEGESAAALIDTQWVPPAPTKLTPLSVRLETPKVDSDAPGSEAESDPMPWGDPGDKASSDPMPWDRDRKPGSDNNGFESAAASHVPVPPGSDPHR
jgi:hypothetical protein